MQGGIFEDLRAESAQALAAMDFPGYAIGGLSVGESKEEMLRILDLVTPLLPESKPRYLMGVGSPEDLVEGVARGIDLFDCACSPRAWRANGAVLTREGRLNLRAMPPILRTPGLSRRGVPVTPAAPSRELTCVI